MAKRAAKHHAVPDKKLETLRELIAKSHRNMAESQKLMQRMRALASEIEEERVKGTDRRSNRTPQ
jgi:hypothetical protein